jgi:hypothetical protein
MTQVSETKHAIPNHLFLGITLTAAFWFASWTQLGLAGEHSFFALWFGYILTVDGVVAIRRGSSLLMRAPQEFAALFVLSAPVWWIFEFLNYFVLNWHYITPQNYSAAHIIIEATINFGTVIPAVFETTELVSTFGFTKNLHNYRINPISRRALWVLMYAGVAAFAAMIFAPTYAFPMTWIWLFLLIDPLNNLRGRPSLLAQAAQGEWRQIASLAIAVLICGFFWEMWNYFAMPKWYYTVPFFGFVKIFEMPLLGYFGYIPFGLELYALYHFVWGVLGRQPQALQLDVS